jgi:hypothetical protein
MAEVIDVYDKRWGIDSTVRDIKENRFGMGMADIHTTFPDAIHHNVA